MIKMFKFRQSLMNNALKCLLISGSLFMGIYAMIMPIHALFVQEIGGDLKTASVAYTIYWLTAGLFTFLTSKIESKMKETELAIAFSQFIITFAYIIYYFTASPGTLYVAMFFIGLANAFFWPAYHVVFAKHTQKKYATMQWGFFDASSYLVPAIGSLIGGFLAAKYGFDLIFIIMAVLSFLNGLFIVILPRKLL
jgi:MFS transporter, DHA1 family, multidrug resistance protein